MAGVRCTRKPAAPGKPRPAHPLQPARQAPNGCRKQCAEPAGNVTMPCPLRLRTCRLPRPCSKKTPPPRFYAARGPMKKREPFVPGKTAFRNPLCRTNAKLPDTTSTAAKTGAQRGLKCLQRENLQKIRKNTGPKNTQRPENSCGGVSGRPYLMTKKIPLPDRQRGSILR